jgi:hypothetical protein
VMGKAMGKLACLFGIHKWGPVESSLFPGSYTTECSRCEATLYESFAGWAVVKKVKVKSLAILVLVGATIVFAVDGNYHHHAYTVTTVAPIIVTPPSPTGFVLGTDGIARTCPDQKNVGEYVRQEGKGAPMVFAYVMSSKAVIISTPEHGFTIACLKVE